MKGIFDEFYTHHNSRRLYGYDYSLNGEYFITIVTQDRAKIFGQVAGEAVILSKLGVLAEMELQKSFEMRKEMVLDCFVIMPNHIHFIAELVKQTPDSLEKSHSYESKPVFQRKPKSISTLVSGFKSAVTRQSRRFLVEKRLKIWQANYIDHIIRDERDLEEHRQYVCNNPLNWGKDEFYL